MENREKRGVTTKILNIGYSLVENREGQATINTIETLLM